jgi:hypothetical protein
MNRLFTEARVDLNTLSLDAALEMIDDATDVAAEAKDQKDSAANLQRIVDFVKGKWGNINTEGFSNPHDADFASATESQVREELESRRAKLAAVSVNI